MTTVGAMIIETDKPLSDERLEQLKAEGYKVTQINVPKGYLLTGLLGKNNSLRKKHRAKQQLPRKARRKGRAV
jgi:hypothetical protein